MKFGCTEHLTDSQKVSKQPVLFALFEAMKTMILATKVNLIKYLFLTLPEQPHFAFNIILPFKLIKK